MDSNAPIYHFGPLDFMVMGLYFLMLVSVGFLMKRVCRNTKDYFIGGNRVSWWLAGASGFMMAFSAWTFTGAAGFAYKNGIRIIVLFFFNVVAFTIMGLSLAAKCRQTRCVTSLEIIFNRFGRITEQFLTYIRMPMMLFGGAIWMMGLATFVSVAFGLPMDATILFSGTIIILYSTLSGSLGVITTDFLQSVILLGLTVTIAVLTLIKTGGPVELATQIPPDRLQLFNTEHNGFWMTAYFLQILVAFCSVLSAPRFLAVRTGKDASKAAFLIAGLFMIGPIIWFLPPIAASFLFPNIGEMLPGLQNPQDGAYVLMGLQLLPSGLAGLLLMVVFAATLSSMDSAINQNTAIVCTNFYKPILRPNATEHEMFVTAHIVNVLLGVLVMGMALMFSHQTSCALFDLQLLLSANIVLPTTLPFILMYWFRRTPRWSAIVSSLFGTAFSVLGKTYGFILGPHVWITEKLNAIGLTNLDPSAEWPLHVNVFGILLFGGGSFILSSLLWKRESPAGRQLATEFYETMDRPVDEEKENIGPADNWQFVISGRLSMIMGGFILLLVFAPADWIGRLAILLTGGFVFAIGLTFHTLSRKQAASVKRPPDLE